MIPLNSGNRNTSRTGHQKEPGCQKMSKQSLNVLSACQWDRSPGQQTLFGRKTNRRGRGVKRERAEKKSRMKETRRQNTNDCVDVLTRMSPTKPKQSVFFSLIWRTFINCLQSQKPAHSSPYTQYLGESLRQILLIPDKSL